MKESRCRACRNAQLHPVLSLGMMPLANRLLSAEELELPEPRYPLELAFCSACALVQIMHSVSPEDLFEQYAYFSSWSTTAVSEAKTLVQRLVEARRLDSDSLVVEIASNDGYLLQHYLPAGVPVLGIDPARNVAAEAEKRGVPTVCSFFGADTAEKLRASGRRASVIHANNVLAHVPDINGFVTGLARLLADGGVAVIETPYVRDLVDHLEFDTIYHEHLYYYSLTALDSIFRRNGLHLAAVERIPIHGGSLRVFADTATERPDPSVGALLAEEEALGMATPDYFRGFAARVTSLHRRLVEVLGNLKASGRHIAGYGAAAKGAVLLNACGIGRETLDFVADRSTYKQGLYMPGVHVPVVAPDRLLEERPDDVLLLTWNFAGEILDQQADYRRRGGRFMIPIPEPVFV